MVIVVTTITKEGATKKDTKKEWCAVRLSAVTGAIVALLAVAVPGGSSVSAAASGARPFTSGYTFLSGVSCPSPSFCMAVGASTDADRALRTLAERWNGRSWRIVPTLNQGGPRSGDELLSVSCPSATSCMAVGDALSGSVPVSEEWNGAAWSLLRTPFPQGGRDATLQSVSCPTASSCVAAGSSDNHSGLPPVTLIERWNGLRWALAASPNPPGAAVSALWAVNCLSPALCTAVGDSAGNSSASETTLVEQGNGNSWTVVPSPGVPNRQTALFAVNCVSASACTAAGAKYHATASNFTATPLIEHESKGTWHVSPAPYPAGTSYDQFGGLACTRATRCTATGSAQSSLAITTLVESESAGKWSIVTSPNAPGSLSALGSISCISSALCMAVGDNDNGTGLRLALSELWNGTAWTIIPTPNP